MSLTKLTDNLNIIQALPDKPVDTATVLKQKFDLSGNKIKEYINEKLTEDIDTELETKANSSDVYKKTEIDTLLETKANSSDVYKKTEIDTLLEAKANSSDVSNNYKQKSAFNILKYGVFIPSSQYETIINYPEGFMENNCVLLNFQYSGNNSDVDFEAILSSEGIVISRKSGSAVRDENILYEIVLMRTDI